MVLALTDVPVSSSSLLAKLRAVLELQAGLGDPRIHGTSKDQDETRLPTHIILNKTSCFPTSGLHLKLKG